MGGILILRPFPSSADRGFAPATYMEMDPRFGSWEDMRHIGESHDILIDLMVIDIWRQSRCFQDLLAHSRRLGTPGRYAEVPAMPFPSLAERKHGK
jgi:sucrose phosphorylase